MLGIYPYITRRGVPIAFHAMARRVVGRVSFRPAVGSCPTRAVNRPFTLLGLAACAEFVVKGKAPAPAPAAPIIRKG